MLNKYLAVKVAALLFALGAAFSAGRYYESRAVTSDTIAEGLQTFTQRSYAAAKAEHDALRKKWADEKIEWQDLMDTRGGAKGAK